MKPKIKISFEDFKKYAIEELIKAGIIYNNTINPETAEFKVIRHDGDHTICEIPDYVELEIQIPNRNS